MGRPGDDHELLFAAKLRERCLVEGNDRNVIPADGHLRIGAADTSLVQHDERNTEAPCVSAGNPHAADVRRHHDHVTCELATYRLAQRRNRRQAIDRRMKKAFDLRGCAGPP